jgi:hypothetical protein
VNVRFRRKRLTDSRVTQASYKLASRAAGTGPENEHHGPFGQEKDLLLFLFNTGPDVFDCRLRTVEQSGPPVLDRV